jgi:NADH:ubiquinone oxidoreductase subunit 6 (subunit J)
MRNCSLRVLSAVVVAAAAVMGAPSAALGAGASSPVTDVPVAAPGGFFEAAMFYLVAGGAVFSVLGVCISRNIVRMAVWLFIALGSVALLYFLLAAYFLGAIQLIVYAGGTLVLLIFGVMLTSKSPWVKFEVGKGELVLASLVCVTLLGVLFAVLSRATWAGTEAVVPGAPVAALGYELMTKYLVPFEVAGVLLMIVMVGAAHLARQQD